MIPASLQRSLRSRAGVRIETISLTYVLGAGHVRFFYNKGKFLENRYRILVEEMLYRGMKPDPARLFPVDAFPIEFYNDWVPSEEEINISRHRIEERVAKKPSWYRKTKRL
jgi:deoxyribonuclease (pyrimidine dimer)